MVRLLKRGRKPSKSLKRKLRRLMEKKVSELSVDDLEVLRRYNLLRSRRSLLRDFSRSAHVPKHVGPWIKHPGRYDVPNVDTPNSKYSEVIEEVRKRLEKKRERKTRIEKESEVKYSGGWGQLIINGVRIPSSSLRGGFNIGGREYARLIKGLANNAGYTSSFMYVGGNVAGFMGFNDERSMAFDVQLSNVAEGEVWPIQLSNTGLRSISGNAKGIDVKVRPDGNGKAKVIVNGLDYETPKMKAYDVETITLGLRTLHNITNEHDRVDITINNKKVLQRLIKYLRNGKFVKIGLDGITVYDVSDRKWVIRADGFDVDIKNHAGDVEPVWVSADLLLSALPPNACVVPVQIRFMKRKGPIMVRWSDGIVYATYFLAPLSDEYVKEVKKRENEEIGKIEEIITLNEDVVDYLRKLVPVKRKYGFIDVCVVKDAIIVGDRDNTAVLVIRLPRPSGVPDGKVLVVEDFKGLKNLIRNSIRLKVRVNEDGVAEGVSDDGSEAIIGIFDDIGKVRIPNAVVIIGKDGVDKFEKRLVGGWDGRITKDVLLKKVRKKFNQLVIRKHGGKVELELMEERKWEEPKYVGSLGSVRSGVDKGFTVGSDYASVKPWLVNLVKLGRDYYTYVKVHDGAVFMKNDNVLMGLTESY